MHSSGIEVTFARGGGRCATAAFPPPNVTASAGNSPAPKTIARLLRLSSALLSTAPMHGTLPREAVARLAGSLFAEREIDGENARAEHAIIITPTGRRSVRESIFLRAPPLDEI